ncbi:prepilin-type N-terminal cleavage/methylation domain-containing protein [Massilia sp. PAMC28688]|uniref:type IV pilin protein n=1 Tax=Massilia sp. PAMC28688 TaxID=2861283 RepID=UPI001C62FF53|nr:prepilin-type N-terminal cleavage/methylation domain-containing protein [Massilia sp. PAMC28688]QYF92868.1 prepilin-type N-terminal cleavage/methylation domain-containing protein [Massilia sp. PAMC28688]
MVRKQRGFTLMEVMIAVAIIGILSAIALPSYNQHVTRTRLNGGFSALASMELVAEQFWPNDRTYVGLDERLPADTDDFTYEASDLTASTYTVTATGRAKADGFVYSIDQNGVRKTVSVPEGGEWEAKDTCWVDRKGGLCTQ